jgi:CheY-like chemotaxis protein
MPKMDGKDVLTAIRQQSKYNNIPVIIISVDGLDEDELLITLPKIKIIRWGSNNRYAKAYLDF